MWYKKRMNFAVPRLYHVGKVIPSGWLSTQFQNTNNNFKVLHINTLSLQIVHVDLASLRSLASPLWAWGPLLPPSASPLPATAKGFSLTFWTFGLTGRSRTPYFLCWTNPISSPLSLCDQIYDSINFICFDRLNASLEGLQSWGKIAHTAHIFIMLSDFPPRQWSAVTKPLVGEVSAWPSADKCRARLTWFGGACTAPTMVPTQQAPTWYK